MNREERVKQARDRFEIRKAISLGVKPLYADFARLRGGQLNKDILWMNRMWSQLWLKRRLSTIGSHIHKRWIYMYY